MNDYLPIPFIQSLQHAPGFNEFEFVQTHNDAKQITSIRLNPQKPTNGIAGLPIQAVVPWCSTGRYLYERPSFTLDPIFHGGAYYVQEASSMFLNHILTHIYKEKSTPQRVLDLCAAPGGKSTLLAAALPHSCIVSNEVIKTRVSVLAENMVKWGSANVFITHNDPADFQQLPGYFDLLVIDAPCSGSGLFRKDRNAVDQWSVENVHTCSLRQKRIITDTIRSLKQDGYLIYSTCSYSVEENEAICDWIVHTFNLEPVHIPLEDSWGIVKSVGAIPGAVGYRFYPDKVDGEGFFIACFKQNNSTEDYYHHHTPLQPLPKKDRSIAEQFINQASDYILTGFKEIVIASPVQWKDEIATLNAKLNLRRSGVCIGEIKGKDLIPHHELALSSVVSSDIPHVEIDKENALRYLRRQEMQSEISQKGWTICQYEDIRLGWVKVLPNRVNNYYPVNWRILKL